MFLNCIISRFGGEFFSLLQLRLQPFNPLTERASRCAQFVQFGIGGISIAGMNRGLWRMSQLFGY